MTTAHPFKRAGKVWRVVGRTVDAAGNETGRFPHGFGETCGHYHATADEAYACPWEPVPCPPIYAGLVVDVRDDRDDGAEVLGRREQGQLPWRSDYVIGPRQ